MVTGDTRPMFVKSLITDKLLIKIEHFFHNIITVIMVYHHYNPSHHHEYDRDNFGACVIIPSYTIMTTDQL